MSYMKLQNLFLKADKHLYPLNPVSTCIYEDYLKSSIINPVSMLQSSNQREQLNMQYEQHIQPYIQSLKKMLMNYQTISYCNNENPLVFSWNVNNTTYSSTSLFFEYYMTNLMQNTRNISQAITIKSKKAADILKETKNNLLHLMKLLPEWKTQHLIQPKTPNIVHIEFLRDLIYFCHATQAFYLSSHGAVAFHTASHYYGKMWFRNPIYGNIAQNHYLLSTALCYHAMSTKCNEEQNEEKHTLLSTMLDLYNNITFSECYLIDELKENTELVEDCKKEVRTLQTVYYTTGTANISNIKKPKYLELKVCPKNQTFGCKCKK